MKRILALITIGFALNGHAEIVKSYFGYYYTVEAETGRITPIERQNELGLKPKTNCVLKSKLNNLLYTVEPESGKISAIERQAELGLRAKSGCILKSKLGSLYIVDTETGKVSFIQEQNEQQKRLRPALN